MSCLKIHFPLKRAFSQTSNSFPPDYQKTAIILTLKQNRMETISAQKPRAKEN